MWIPVLLSLSICFLSADTVSVPPKPGDDLGAITTADGKTYTGVKLVGSEPDGITIIYSDGGAKISFQNLPVDLQKRFGIDPNKAEIYALKTHYERQIADLTEQNMKLHYQLSQYKGALTESRAKPRVGIEAFHAYLYQTIGSAKWGSDGIMHDGAYAGLNKAQFVVAAQQKWSEMSDDEKAAYEKLAQQTGDPYAAEEAKEAHTHFTTGTVSDGIINTISQ
jgi:hypothetical protein